MESSPSSEEEQVGREITDEEATDFAREKSFEVFISTLKRKKRDMEGDGKLLKEGTVVINNPENPASLAEDNPNNRREFIQHGFQFAFTNRYRSTKEQKNNVLIGEDAKEYFDAAVNRAKDFKEKIDAIKPVPIVGEKRDAEGKLLKGVKVIIDPTYEELFMEDTPENRADFIKNGGTWKKEK